MNVSERLQEWTLKQALDFVSAARPQVSPNAGFMARLIRLEESLHGTKTVKVQPPSRLPSWDASIAEHSVLAAPLDNQSQPAYNRPCCLEG